MYARCELVAPCRLVETNHFHELGERVRLRPPWTDLAARARDVLDHSPRLRGAYDRRSSTASKETYEWLRPKPVRRSKASEDSCWSPATTATTSLASPGTRCSTSVRR